MISPDLRFRIERLADGKSLPPVGTQPRASSDAPVPMPNTGEVSVTSRDAPLSRDDSSLRVFPAERGGTHSLIECSDRRAPGETESAICVQRLDDSLNSAIHTRYRSLLRSSSMHEPRGPPLEVVSHFLNLARERHKKRILKKKWYGGAGRKVDPGFDCHPHDLSRGPADPLARSDHQTGTQRFTEDGKKKCQPVMILPQVHLRKPCYDFYFL